MSGEMPLWAWAVCFVFFIGMFGLLWLILSVANTKKGPDDA